MLLGCAVLPYVVSISNTLLGVGPPDFPFTATTVALMWPAFAWAGLKLRVYDFNPFAYKTLFDHVRDPIFVLDNDQRIIQSMRVVVVTVERNQNTQVGRFEKVGLQQRFLCRRRTSLARCLGDQVNHSLR